MTRHLITTAILALALGTPAMAGQPDQPGRPGEIVNDSRIGWQATSPSGWGKRVSSKAGPDQSLGKFLKETAGGPNPDNDNGKGND